MPRGDKWEWDDHDFTMVGAYFDWPWWKRVLATIAARPAAVGYGAWLAIRRLRHRPWGCHDHDDLDPPETCVCFPVMYRLGYSHAHSRIKPIFWEMNPRDPSD